MILSSKHKGPTSHLNCLGNIFDFLVLNKVNHDSPECQRKNKKKLTNLASRILIFNWQCHQRMDGHVKKFLYSKIVLPFPPHNFWVGCHASLMVPSPSIILFLLSHFHNSWQNKNLKTHKTSNLQITTTLASSPIGRGGCSVQSPLCCIRKW